MNKIKNITVFKPEQSDSFEIPFAASTVHAGFPSPADDFLEGTLNLNSLVIRHPEATFFGRVEGDSMIGEGISEGDILVIDRSIEPYDGCLVVAYIDSEFTLKRLKMKDNKVLLVPANPKYKTIEITPDNEFSVWGVVNFIVKKV